MPYLSTSAVVILYEEALYQVYAPLPLPLSACSAPAKKERDARRAITRVHRAHTRHLANRDHATSIEWKWT